MNLSIFEKISIIFKYVFSSFLGIGLFIICSLLLAILLVNIKRNNNIYKILLSILFLFSFIILILSVHLYAYQCIKILISYIMKYIYFPSTIVYFFIMLFVIIVLLYTIISSKLSLFKKVFNFIFMLLTIFLYLIFMSLVLSNSIDLLDKTTLYSNDIILATIQVSNFILFFWIVYTMFYYLFKYYKNKFDNK